MTLKEMIEEARIMAETPDLDVVKSNQEDFNLSDEYSSRKSSTSQGTQNIWTYLETILYFIVLIKRIGF